MLNYKKFEELYFEWVMDKKLATPIVEESSTMVQIFHAFILQMSKITHLNTAKVPAKEITESKRKTKLLVKIL